jgi:predicted RND superfamily exporter protein
MKTWLTFVDFSTRRPTVALVVGLLLSVLAGLGAMRIKVDAGLEALLPADSPTLHDMDVLRDRVAGTTPLRVAAASSDRELNRLLIRALVAEIEQWPETRVVFDRRDPSYLIERRLLLLPESELSSLADTLEARLDWEGCERMPACVNFDDRPELPSEEELAERWRALPDARALDQFFGAGLMEGSASDVVAGARDANARPAGEVGVLCNEDGTVCALQAILDGDPRQLDHALTILNRTEALFETLRGRLRDGQLGEAREPPADLQMVVDGVYRNAPMTKRAVSEDLTRTSWLGSVLLVLVLAIQFRAVRAVPFLLLPCAAGILWTLGILGAAGVTLNLISAFVMAILMGIGVDFGVHLLSFYGRARSEHDVREALLHTARELAPAMLAAGLTTIAGFLALLGARFRGLSQLGPIAAVGIALTLLAFALLFPSLVVFAQRLRPLDQGLTRSLSWVRPPTYGGVAARVVVLAGVLLAAGLGALALGAVGPGVALDTSSRGLENPDVRHGLDVSGAFPGTTRTNVVILSNSPEELSATIADLRTREEERVPLSGALILAPETFFPTDVAGRMEQVERLEEITGNMLRRLEDPPQSLRNLHDLAAGTTPLELEDMPPWLREQLVERDGSFGRLAVLFLRMRGSDSLLMAELTAAMNRWRADHAGVAFSSTHALLGEVIPTLQHDGPRMFGLAVAGVLLALLLLARSVRRGALALAPLVISTACIAGSMVLFDLKLNMFNLLVVPVGFGIAIDGAIYVAWHMGDTRGPEASSTFRAVLFSTLTTLTAFGTLVVANHPGLASIGELALVTMSIGTVVNLLWLPALVSLWPERTSAAAPPLEPPASEA